MGHAVACGMPLGKVKELSELASVQYQMEVSKAAVELGL